MHIDGLEFEVRGAESRDSIILEQVVAHNLYRLPDDMTAWNVLDIGGHIGAVALMSAKRGARVYTFEPEIETFKILTHNINRNHLSDKVTAYNMAVGAQSGEYRKLYHHPTEHGSASLFVAQNPTLSADYELVWTISLGMTFVVSQAESFDFVKLDCEGCECELVPQILIWHNALKRIGLELHGTDEENQNHLALLKEYYDITPLSHIEFLLEHKVLKGDYDDRTGNIGMD